MEIKRIPIVFLEKICDVIRFKLSSYDKYSLKELPEIIKNIPSDKIDRFIEDTVIDLDVFEADNVFLVRGCLNVDGSDDVVVYLDFAPIDFIGSNGEIINNTRTNDVGEFAFQIDKKNMNPYILDNSFFKFDATKYYNTSESSYLQLFIKFYPRRDAIHQNYENTSNGLCLHFKKGKYIINNGKAEYQKKDDKDLEPIDAELIESFYDPAYIYHPSEILSCDERLFYNWQILDRVYLPEGIFILGKECFSKSGISYIKIPESVLFIEEGCFKDCVKLNNISLSNIIDIPKDCFNGCSSLSKIVIPSSVEHLDEGSFSNMNLTKITFKGKPPEIHEKAFENTNLKDCICSVSEDYLEEYKANKSYKMFNIKNNQ